MTLYKGRLNSLQNEWMKEINVSLPVDIRFLPFDIGTNAAWANELNRLGILDNTEYELILEELDEIAIRYADDEFEDEIPDDEDVHTLVERLLTEKLPEIGPKIHTGRSRNDQVVCDLRMFLRQYSMWLAFDLGVLIGTLANLAEEHKETIMAGSTHMQPAQPITLGQFLLSLAFALKRDADRLWDSLERINLCPLGSGALAGSGFPVDRERLAELLGFDAPTDNSIDSISDRDIVQEAVNNCAITMTHLSRYAEQFIIWANPAFGYIQFSDDWSTGSSMMPQKKNPDAMELIRGKAARVIGSSTAMLALTKGVPLSYAKDLQEDKEALFDAIDTTRLSIHVFNGALESAKFNPENMIKALTGDMLATDLADMLVEKKVPFRLAHERVAQFVTQLENEQRDLLSASSKELSLKFPELGKKLEPLRFTDSVNRRNLYGGTSPEAVMDQIDNLRIWLEELYPEPETEH